MSYCNICVKDITPKTKTITCGRCDFTCCSMCVERHLIASIKEPHCMSCNLGWTYDKIYDSFDNEFTYDYEQTRIKIFLDREKARLQMTQNDAVLFLKKEDIGEQIKALTKQISRLNESYAVNFDEEEVEQAVAKILLNTSSVNDKRKRIDLISTNKRKAKGDIEKFRKKKRDLEQRLATINQTGKDKITQFACKCPIDDCKGYVGLNWFCELCLKKICEDCREENIEGHVCNEELVETVREIARDSRPCPKCGLSISKTQGCSQVWCPGVSKGSPCNTTFDYNTGEIDNGFQHNPHYLDWVKSQRKLKKAQPKQQDCNDPCLVFSSILTTDNPNKDMGEFFNQLAINSFHNRAVLNENSGIEGLKTDLRIKYLLNRLNEKDWLKQLKIIYKTERNRKCEMDIYQTFFVATGEMGNDLIIIGKEYQNRDITPEIYREFCKETSKYYTMITNLITHCNKSLREVGERYNFKVVYITKYGRLITFQK